MQEIYEKFEDFLTEDGEMTTKEFTLTVLCAFLIGLVLGMFLSPRKHTMIGSNNCDNGNNCGSTYLPDYEDGYVEEIEVEEIED